MRSMTDPKLFWKEMPGANLYLLADKIASLNIRYEFPGEDFTEDTEQVMRGFGEEVTAEYEKGERGDR